MIRTLDLLTFKKRSRGAPAGSVPARICAASDLRDFASFWPRSSRLGAARCYPFQCADLIELRCETVAAARRANPVFLAILGFNNEPLALLPLCIEHAYERNGMFRDLRILKFLDGGLSDYNAPIMFPAAQSWGPATVQRIWRGMRRILPAFDIAILENMPDLVDDLPNPFRFLRSEPQGKCGHAVHLSGTWEAITTKLPRRKGLRRKARRLSRLGEMTFEIAETPEQYDAFLEVLLRQKRRRDIEAHGHDSLASPGYPAYLRLARGHLYPSGPVCLFALRVDNIILATLFGVVAGSRFIAQIPGFEGDNWQVYSSGHLLYAKVVEWCFQEGIRVFDLGAGDEQWKDEYCDDSMTLYETRIPCTIRGAVALRWPRMAIQIHGRRVNSWREMELAESFCLVDSGASRALAHAARSLALWPSPRRTREFLAVARNIRANRAGKLG